MKQQEHTVQATFFIEPSPTALEDFKATLALNATVKAADGAMKTFPALFRIRRKNVTSYPEFDPREARFLTQRAAVNYIGHENIRLQGVYATRKRMADARHAWAATVEEVKSAGQGWVPGTVAWTHKFLGGEKFISFDDLCRSYDDYRSWLAEHRG